MPLSPICNKTNDFILCKGVEEKFILNFNANIIINDDFCEKNEAAKAEIRVDGIDDKLQLQIECQKCKCQDITKKAAVCMSRGDLRCSGCQC